MLYLVYFSPTATTKRVLEQIAAGIGQAYQTIDLTSKTFRNRSLMFDENDLILIGMPVYAGRIPQLMAEYLETLDGGGALAVPVVVYGNRDYDDALLELRDLCQTREFKIAGAAAFIGEHSYTEKVAYRRPDEQDAHIAQQFGKSLVWEEKKLNIKGNRPYRAYVKSLPLGPSTHSTCNACGLCMKDCPVEAISKENPTRVDETLCIRCFKCVRLCPIQAKYFDERIVPIKEWLIDNFTERKEPEIYF